MSENKRQGISSRMHDREWDETSNRQGGRDENESSYGRIANYNDAEDYGQQGQRQQYRNRSNQNDSYNNNSMDYSQGGRYGQNRDREAENSNTNYDYQNTSREQNHGGYDRGQQYGGQSGWGNERGWGNEGRRGQGRSQSGRDNNNWGQNDSQYGGYGQRGSQYRNDNFGQNGSRYDMDRDSQSGSGNYGQGGSQYGSGNNSNWGQGSSQSRQGQSGTQYGDSSGSSHKGKGPKGYRRSDDRIQEEINDRLTDDAQLDASQIEVKVSNNEVKLTGTVDSREAKRRAEDLAESISGVSNIENSLRVKQDKSDNNSYDQNMSSTKISSTGSLNSNDSHHDKNKKNSVA